MRALFFCCLLLMLSACASFQGKAKTVILKHPDTLDFQSCQVEFWGLDSHYAANDACVQKYLQEGYQIWGQR